jgi:hypothetical protein
MRTYMLCIAGGLIVCTAAIFIWAAGAKPLDMRAYTEQRADIKKDVVASCYEILYITEGISRAWSNALYSGSDPKRSVDLYTKLISNELKEQERQSTIIEIQIREIKKKYSSFKASTRILDQLYEIRSRLIAIALNPPEKLSEFTAQTNDLAQQLINTLATSEPHKTVFTKKIQNGASVYHDEDMSEKFHLTGLFYNPTGESSAIINGIIAYEGDDQSGMQVIKINKQSVDILVAGKRGFLKVP